MSKLAEIQKTLETFQSQYGISILSAEQGSTVWMTAKLGVISASNAHRAVAKEGSETRATYMAELIAQVCTGIFEEVNSKHLDWGKQHEDAARACYEFMTGDKVHPVCFVFKDNSYRAGCSPDGYVSDTKWTEIKCPFTSVQYIKFLADEKLKSEWLWQVQFDMWVTGAEEWDFVQYDERMKRTQMKIVPIKRDPEKMKVFDEMIPKFIADMDNILAKIGIKFGEQWERLGGDVLNRK